MGAFGLSMFVNWYSKPPVVLQHVTIDRNVLILQEWLFMITFLETFLSYIYYSREQMTLLVIPAFVSLDTCKLNPKWTCYTTLKKMSSCQAVVNNRPSIAVLSQSLRLWWSVLLNIFQCPIYSFKYSVLRSNCSIHCKAKTQALFVHL